LAQGLIFGLSFGSWGQVFSPVLAHGASFGHSFGPGGNRQNEYSDDPNLKKPKVHSCDQVCWVEFQLDRPTEKFLDGGFAYFQ